MIVDGGLLVVEGPKVVGDLVAKGVEVPGTAPATDGYCVTAPVGAAIGNTTVATSGLGYQQVGHVRGVTEVGGATVDAGRVTFHTTKLLQQSLHVLILLIDDVGLFSAEPSHSERNLAVDVSLVCYGKQIVQPAIKV